MLVELACCKLVNLIEGLSDASQIYKDGLIGVMLACCGAFGVAKELD
jgi:hypothetical protein